MGWCEPAKAISGKPWTYSESPEDDPLNAIWEQWLAVYLMPQGRLDEADQAIGKAIKLKPGFRYNHYLLTISQVLRRNAVGAQKAADAEPAVAGTISRWRWLPRLDRIVPLPMPY